MKCYGLFMLQDALAALRNATAWNALLAVGLLFGWVALAAAIVWAVGFGPDGPAVVLIASGSVLAAIAAGWAVGTSRASSPMVMPGGSSRMANRGLLDRRTLWGLAIAPLLPVVGVLVIITAFSVTGERGHGLDARAVLSILEFGTYLSANYYVPMSYGAVLLVALPVHVVLRRLQVTSLRAYVMAGAASTALPAVLVFEPDIGGVLPTLGFLQAGPVAALAFWTIARPDKVNTAAAERSAPVSGSG